MSVIIGTLLIISIMLPFASMRLEAEESDILAIQEVKVFNLSKQNVLQSNDVRDVFIYDITKDNVDYTTWYNDRSKSWWQEIDDSKKKLLLWNKMGSDDQITNSEIGPNGTIYGNVSYSDSKFWNGVNTTGLNNYIEFDNVSTRYQKWTVDFYFTPLQDFIYGSTIAHGQGQWLMGYDSTGTFRYGFYWHSPYKILVTELAPTRLSLKYPSVDFKANEIYHIRLVVDRTLSGSNRHKLFIDGEFQTPVVHADYGNVDGPLERLRFGAHVPTPPNADGSAIFDNIKIYNYSNLNFEERFYEDNSERNSHFPQKSYLITTDEGLDIIDASNNKLWMRFEEGINNGLPSTDFNAAEALDGKVFVGSDAGLFKFDFIDNIINRIDCSGVASYNGDINTRNSGKGYGTITGTGIINDTVNDIALITNYALIGTDGGVSSITLSSGVVYDDSGDVCSAVYITDDGELIYSDPDNLLRKNSLPVSDWDADNSTYITGINDIVANDDKIFVAVEGGEVAVVNVTMFNVSEQIVKSSFDDSEPHFWNKMENVVGSTLVSEIGTNLTLTGTSYDIEPAMFNNGWDNSAESTYAYANSNDIIASSQKGAVEFYWVPDDDADTTLGWYPPPGSHNKASWFFSNGATNRPVNDRWYFEMMYTHFHSPPIFEGYMGKSDSFGNYHRCTLWPHHIIRGNWTAGDKVHVAFAWHNESVILGKYICALWFNGELQNGWLVPDFGTLEGWRTTNPTTPYDPRMRIGDSRFSYTADEQLRGPMDSVKTYAYAKDDWGDRHIENGSVTKVFAGDSGNVKALALADDNVTLYVGTNGCGGVSKIDSSTDSLIYNWTSGNSEALVDYNITSLSYWQHPVSENVWELLVGTENGVSVIRQEQKPPIANAGGPYHAQEGSEIEFNASASTDPESDILQYRWDFDNDGNWDTTYSTDPTATQTWYDDYTGTVVVEIYDGEEVSTDSTSITVLNVAPESIFTNNGPKNEGDAVSFTFTDQYDPGTSDTFTYSFDWNNDGTFEITDQSSPTATNTWYDEGVYTVTGRIKDNDGSFSDYSISVTISNVAPTATMSHDGPKNEGDTVSFTFSDQYDPGTSDTFTYSFDWNNDGTFEITDQSSPTATNTWYDEGVYTVIGRIKDDDGGYFDYSVAVTIINVAPTAIMSHDGPKNEGSPVNFSFSEQYDPGTADTFTYCFDWNDDDVFDIDNSTTEYAVNTWFDNGVYWITGRIYDNDGDYTEYTVSVTITNVAPNVSFIVTMPDLFAISGENLTFNGSFTDPGSSDTHNITWIFGDSSFDYGNLDVIHSFDSSGTFNVTLRITDDDGGVGTYLIQVTINSTSDAIDELIDHIEDLNLDNGIDNSLDKKLENVQKSLDSLKNGNRSDAINKLQAFINAVEAQSGNKIDEEDADLLIEYAERLIAELES